MVGLSVNAGTSSLDATIARDGIGGVVLLGGWTGFWPVRAATSHLAGEPTAGLGVLIAADQEGGEVQQLRGSGFSAIPSALTQGTQSTSQETASAAVWAREIRAAGVNVNLAPVADTVPASLGTANGPIGHWYREFSSDPDQVARMVAAFVTGMHIGGVAVTLKHYPGLGRITNNTDLSATGITDTTTTVDDPYLRPFAAGIRSGANLVMVSSAIYSRLDPGVNAVFSHRIITDILRGRLGWGGVTISDDVGAAASVANVPVGQRAVRFIEAGGDIVLTARPSDADVMAAAIVAEAAIDPVFAARVLESTTRVIALKVARGLARC